MILKAKLVSKKIISHIVKPVYLLLWLLLSLYVGMAHEPFADEAQSYLIARDASFFSLFTEIARMEGTPVLWWIWLKILLFVGLPYSLLYLSSVIPNLIAVALFVYKAPFSLVVRLLFPLTYYILYQYNIVARNYSLLFLCIVLVALAWKKRFQHPLRYITAIILLSNVSLYAFILSAGLMADWILEVFKNKDMKKVMRSLAGAVVLYTVFVIYSLWLLWPEESNLYVRNYSQLPVVNFFSRNILGLLSSGIVVSSSPQKENLLLTDMGIIYFLATCYLLAGVFRRSFCLLLVPNLIMMCLVPFKIWHIGILILTVLLIFLQNRQPKKYSRAMKAMLMVFFAVQLIWSGTALVHERNSVYSAGENVYKFLQSQNIKPQNVLFYSFNAISAAPYFQSKEQSLWNWNKQGFVYRISNDNLLKYQAFVMNEEAYIIYKDRLDKIAVKGNYLLKIFPSRYFFALSEKSANETFYVWYRTSDE